MPFPIEIKLAEGKTVLIQSIKVVDFGVASLSVVFVELQIKREYRIEAKSFEAWLVTRGKTVDNFTKADLRAYALDFLLPIYDSLEKAKKIMDRIKGLV
ncbi:hypothetical protein ES703_77977 [subsurface metagenome]